MGTYRQKSNVIRPAFVALILLFLLFGCAKGDLSDRSLTFLSGSSGVNLDDFKGTYLARADLKGKSYAVDGALLDKERVLALTNEYGTLEDPALLKYIASTADKLTAAVGKAGIRNFRPRVIVVADPNVGARATPSGVILITHGLLKQLESEDQLAFVLGHEMGHVLMHHHDKDWLVKGQRHVVAAGEVGKDMANSLAASTGKPQGANTSANNWMLVADGALIASRDVISPAWNRNQEDQADLLGVDLMVAAGYQPREVLKVLQVLRDVEFGGGDTAERKSAENAYSGWTKQAVATNQSVLGGMGKAVGGALDAVGKSISETLSDARRSHRSVDERAALIRDYARREYAQVNAAPQAKSYGAALANPRTKQVLQNYDQTTNALRAMVKAPRNGLETARKGIAAPTEQDSYPRLVLSQAQFARGDRTGGIASLKAATEGPNPALRAYLTLSEAYAKANDHKQAWAVAEAAQKRYQQSEMLLVHRISLHARAGRPKEAQAMAVQCKLEYPALEQACADAARRGVSSVTQK